MTSDASLPGFIDLQVNGFVGADFSSKDLAADSFAEACRNLLKSGTAAFLTTMISSPLDVYERNLPMLASTALSEEFKGRVLGIHLEGPFISREPGAIGYHNPEQIREPDTALLDRLQEMAKGCIKLVTLAPEVAGACELARHAVGMGIRVSVGHSMAMEADLARVVDAGAGSLTHVGNGIPNTIHRHNNPLWPALANDNLTAMVITDGCHVPAPMLKVILRAKGPERIIVVSDVSPLSGLSPGRYSALGNEVVLEKTGRLYNPDKQCLVGSSLPLLQGMNYLAGTGFLSRDHMLAAGFHNPLKLLELKRGDVRGDSRLLYDEKARVFSIEAKAS